MKAAPIKKTVRVGALRLDIREYADGRYGFDFSPPGKDREKVRLRSLAAAEERADEILGAARGGKVERLSIDPDEYAEFLQWKAERKGGQTVPTLVESFIKSKEGKGLSLWHTDKLKNDLKTFSERFPGPLEKVRREQVEDWLNSLNVGPRRWNNIRETVIALTRFARKDGAVRAELIGAELVGRRKVEVQVQTYSPDELEKLIEVVPHEWLPAIVLGAFAGIRPQELCPEPRSKKPGLTWGNILWDRSKIDVPAKVSKTGKRRFVPLLEPAIAFLSDRRDEPANKLVCPVSQINKRTGGWGKAAGVEWKPDALRHSFASYRLALTKDMAALALEMGNSPSIIFKHYLDLKHEDEAEKWFGIRPKSSKKVHPSEAQNP